MQLQKYGRRSRYDRQMDKEIRTYDFWTNWESNIRE